MDIAINNAFIVDPRNRVYSKLNIGINCGKIVEISAKPLKGDRIIEAEGLTAVPGFVDAHMHEGKYDRGSNTFNTDIFECMLRMGVTTAVGGNCGSGPERPDEYLNAVENIGIPVNLALLVPHNTLRKEAGENNKYKNASKCSIEKMRKSALYYLERGCIGISFGIRYIPGINDEELISICQAAASQHKIAAAHVRDDAKNIVPSVMELIRVSEALDVPIQISHIGSMGAYGQMQELLSVVDLYKSKGMDIGMDCYPYDAFSTGIGETTYDEGFLKRYETTYESIEIAEGKYRGTRCTEELFKRLRREEPELITIGHVMKEAEVDMAMSHPGVLVGSDGYLHRNQGHPRASGTFPRVINEYVKKKKLLTLNDAVGRMTYMTAERFGINKGDLGIGSDADVVVFDFEALKDCASFDNPVAPPEGIKYVILNGKIAVMDNEIVNKNLGRAIKKGK